MLLNTKWNDAGHPLRSFSYSFTSSSNHKICGQVMIRAFTQLHAGINVHLKTMIDLRKDLTFHFSCIDFCQNFSSKQVCVVLSEEALKSNRNRQDCLLFLYTFEIVN